MMIRWAVFTVFLCISFLHAEETKAALKKADELGKELRELLVNTDFLPFWAEDDSRLIYRIKRESGNFFFHELDFATGKSSLAFDHARLSKALSDQGSEKIHTADLPLQAIQPVPGGKLIRFYAFGKRWQWNPEKNLLEPDPSPPEKLEPDAPGTHRRSRNSDVPTTIFIENATDHEMAVHWLEPSGRARSYGAIPAGKTRELSTFAGHTWRFSKPDGEALASVAAMARPGLTRITGKIDGPISRAAHTSPDGRWSARIKDHNLLIESPDGKTSLSTTEGNGKFYYSGPFRWAPDSKRLIIWKTPAVDVRKIHIVQSSPEDQLQPKLLTLDYAKPGDEIAQRKPVMIDLTKDGLRESALDDALFKNPWSLSRTEWDETTGEFRFLYNERGHQTLRYIGIHPVSRETRVIYEESSHTFIDYSQKLWFHRFPETGEALITSERDGYNHLYLIDERGGTIRRQITSGPWNVRQVHEVKQDSGNIELLVEVIGVDATHPYHSHYGRLALDAGRNVAFTRLTMSPGNHRVDFSPKGKWLLATWSRPDQPPVVELRHTKNGELAAELVRADDKALRARGWQPPEHFVAKGRDGKTDIHGLIYRPTNFDPALNYPVVENIYAGPHDFFTPQSFSAWSRNQAMAELGFIIVKLDGMGTNWRSKAFHDIAWKNLKDSGFPDRILWIQAAAKTRPWMDLDRVGIYGGSAGGQSTLAGLLHHEDFYKVGVADCGCHDNRVDKIWWNEAWMGWPVDDRYADNSNVTHAAKLKGKLLLIVGEIDKNVDPASTSQVVAALQRAGKMFDFVPVMNAGHGAAETPYGRYRRAEFLRRHLAEN